MRHSIWEWRKKTPKLKFIFSLQDDNLFIIWWRCDENKWIQNVRDSQHHQPACTAYGARTLTHKNKHKWTNTIFICHNISHNNTWKFRGYNTEQQERRWRNFWTQWRRRKYSVCSIVAMIVVSCGAFVNGNMSKYSQTFNKISNSCKAYKHWANKYTVQSKKQPERERVRE